MADIHADMVIIGTGVGGATLAHALKDSGLEILILERGDWLPSEPQNWQVRAVFHEGRYRASITWIDQSGKPIHPNLQAFVGGNTKVYGACMMRLRAEDFAELEHMDGTSPAWPLGYDDYSPYYDRAEALFGVHGQAGADPTEPPRAGPYPFAPIPHDPAISALVERLETKGYHPFPLPAAIDQGDGRPCIRCSTCDGFPCRVHAKGDADTRLMRPALDSSSVRLMTGTYAHKLTTSPDGRRITGVEAERAGERLTVSADTYVVAAGAAESALLLLRSANSVMPDGLANRSGQVGRNFMKHNATAMMAINPRKRTGVHYQKTFAVNDFYFGGDGHDRPLGNIQMLGKLQAGMLTADARYVPRPILQEMANRSTDWYLMSEDLPDPDNRIFVDEQGRPHFHWRANNLSGHRALVSAARRLARDGGYPMTITRELGQDVTSHQCGTVRFGNDPATAPLDTMCKAHDHENLYVVDGSFMPSSAAVNPALTICAQALRVAERWAGPLVSRAAEAVEASP